MSDLEDRAWTCHPDDNPPQPCAEKYAYSECVASAASQLGKDQVQSEASRHVVPPGYVLVPEEPTEEMHNAARDWSYEKYGKPIGIDASDGCYRAMIAAAPAPGIEAPSEGGEK